MPVSLMCAAGMNGFQAAGTLCPPWDSLHVIEPHKPPSPHPFRAAAPHIPCPSGLIMGGFFPCLLQLQLCGWVRGSTTRSLRCSHAQRHSRVPAEQEQLGAVSCRCCCLSRCAQQAEHRLWLVVGIHRQCFPSSGLLVVLLVCDFSPDAGGL